MKPLQNPYSDVVTLVIRVTVQLNQLGMEFQKKENTRIVARPDIVFHFYLHKNNFYIAMTGSTGYMCEAMLLADILQNVVQDISRPLHTRLTICENTKAYLEYTDSDNIFEVDEDEEPMYKKRRTVSV